ncbi:MAG TPA: hypothetical protein VKI61_02265 [Chitinophagaceae bacterium]|nr:hypothetical protein [Chitinophagaceae bacterium]
MLSKISWSEFIWFIVFLLIPYYLFVLAVYFKKEVLVFMRNPVLRQRSVFEGEALSEAVPFNAPQVLSANSSSEDISLSVIHDLMEDLKNIFSSASKTKTVKEELIQAIRSKLKSYPTLQGADLQHDISQHIKIEAKDQCGLLLDESDIRQIWQS